MDDILEYVETVSSGDFRKNVAHFTQEAETKGKRIAITNHGRPIAAIVPISDVEALEQMDSEAFAAPERAAPDDILNTEAAPRELQQDDTPIDLSKELAAVFAGSDLLPSAALFAIVPSMIGAYLTGQITQRMFDKNVVTDPGQFGSLQSIVTQTINDSFDRSILPNPPKEILSPIMKFSEPNKAVVGHSTYAGTPD